MTNRSQHADGRRWMLLAMAVYVPLALFGLLWIVLRGGLDGLSAGLVGPAPLRDVTIGVGAGLLVVVIGQIVSRLWPGAQTLEVAMARLTGRLTVRECVLLALFSGIAEELFFRAGMQPSLGIVATSLVFGLLHFPFERALLLWTPFAVGMGFLLGGLYQIDGCAVAPTAAHVVVNALNLCLLQKHWLPGGALTVPESAPDPQSPPDLEGAADFEPDPDANNPPTTSD